MSSTNRVYGEISGFRSVTFAMQRIAPNDKVIIWTPSRKDQKVHDSVQPAVEFGGSVFECCCGHSVTCNDPERTACSGCGQSYSPVFAKLTVEHFGKMVQGELPEGLMPVVRWCYRHLCHTFTSSFEEYERELCREVEPERAIAIWSRSTWACSELVRRQPQYSKREALHDLMLRRPINLNQSHFELLDDLYANPPAELADPYHELFLR